MSKLIKNHKIEFGFVVLSIILLIIYTCRFATIFDEDYSLILSHNTFINIIRLDSVDVHPPLYYFILKIFVALTTFWTESFLIKVISARILSVIISLVSFIFLIKISKELLIKNNVFVQWLLYLLVPGVISFTYEFIKIRMYSLGALFVIIQLYELIKYSKTGNNKYLVSSTLMVVLSLYTNYYTAMISGILLLIYMIDKIINKQKWMNIFMSGIISLILFIPWMPILWKQFSLQANHPIGGFLKQSVVVLLILIIFVYPLMWIFENFRNTYLFKIYLYVFITSLLLFIIMCITSVFFKPVFTFRYFYPILLIYCFLGLNVYIRMLKQHGKCLRFTCSIMIIFLSIILCCGAYISQIQYYGLSSIQIFKDIKSWKNDKNSIIYLKSINNIDKGFDIEKSIYLSQCHKKIIVPDTSTNKPTDIEMTYDNPSYTKLFHNMNYHIINEYKFRR